MALPGAIDPRTGGTVGPAITPYLLTIYERDHPKKAVTFQLGDATPTADEGGGGWGVEEMPKRSPVLIWKGRGGLIKQDIAVVIDGEGQPGPVRTAYTTLQRMWRPIDDTDEPPVVKLRAAGDSVLYKGLDWVIEDVKWGDAVGNAKAERTQQAFTITLREYRPDEKLLTDAEKRKRKAKKKRTYVVRTGDTLMSIAQRFYHDTKQWKRIADAQKPRISDPRHLKVGRRLVIPT